MDNSNALVLSEVRSLAKDLSGSKLLPPMLIGNPANTLAVVLAGRELGLGAMTSIRGLDVIAGKISMSSAMIGALIQSSPVCEYLTPVESTDKVATYETKRKGCPNPVRMSFTIAEAKLAGLAGKDNWRKNPTAMLLARAQARIGRACYPDLMLGVYDRDSGELDDLEKEVNPPPLSQHVEDAKAKLREAVVKPTGDVVEGIVVEPKPTTVDKPKWPPKLAESVAAAKTKEELMALRPHLQAMGEEGKTLFEKRKAEIIAAAKGGAQ